MEQIAQDYGQRDAIQAPRPAAIAESQAAAPLASDPPTSVTLPSMRTRSALPRMLGVAMRVGRHGLGWVVPLVVIAIWELTSRMGYLPARILPSPLHVVNVGIAMTLHGPLLHHLWVSMQRALASLAIGGLLGLTLGLSCGLFRSAEVALDSSFQMLRTIPSLAMIPLAILWFGIGEECKLFLMVLGVFFPLYITAFNGVRSIDPRLIEVGRIYGLNRWQLIRHALLPAALPHLLVGLRLALGFMWINLIVVETIATDSGIGYMVNNAREFMQTDIIVLGICIYALMGKVADSLTRLLERRLLRWNTQFGGM
jgi:sulfonate transport system permease protein